ncbi:hypothetical protein KPH14_004588 [Odynerus spinipes]|uniref:Cytochrome b561 domain-containing protein n=1 Tax=Odynerus spinipes TaxID=1348599 RepID=A0AAD9VQD6_9HYME|nr:hypothetical protein KPH14_004588 [Odynerus spinipes]
MSKGQLVDIHVFICSIGGICVLATPTTMSPKNINEKKELDHGTQGLIGTIIITAGIAVVLGNSEHTYPYHSVAGYICFIAIWIQFLLGTVIFEKNLTANDGLWWAKEVHIVLARTFVAVSPRGDRSSSLGYKGVEELAASSVPKRSGGLRHDAAEFVIVAPT